MHASIATVSIHVSCSRDAVTICRRTSCKRHGGCSLAIARKTGMTRMSVNILRCRNCRKISRSSLLDEWEWQLHVIIYAILLMEAEFWPLCLLLYKIIWGLSSCGV